MVCVTADEADEDAVADEEEAWFGVDGFSSADDDGTVEEALMVAESLPRLSMLCALEDRKCYKECMRSTFMWTEYVEDVCVDGYSVKTRTSTWDVSRLGEAPVHLSMQSSILVVSTTRGRGRNKREREEKCDGMVASRCLTRPPSTAHPCIEML